MWCACGGMECKEEKEETNKRDFFKRKKSQTSRPHVAHRSKNFALSGDGPRFTLHKKLVESQPLDDLLVTPVSLCTRNIAT